MMNATDVTQDIAEGWMDLFDARYWLSYKTALGILGLTPKEVSSTRALDLMPKVIDHCGNMATAKYTYTLELLIEAGRFVGRELDALRIAWACIGVSEVDWAQLEFMVKLGEPTLSGIGRQGNANTADNGTLSSIPGTHLIAKQLGISRAILLGDQESETSVGLWGNLSKVSAALRTYPLHLEKLEVDERFRLQIILLTSLQRAAYHIRTVLVFRAIFHPAFTSGEDGITSLTEWDEWHYHRFCECWGDQVDFEYLQWFVLGHAVSNLKQRWEKFAYATVSDMCGENINSHDFPEKMIAQILNGKKHLVVDRCEKVVRLLNWAGKPAAARHLCDLLQKQLLEAEYRVSSHTLIRAVQELGRTDATTDELSDLFIEKLRPKISTEVKNVQEIIYFLTDPSEIKQRGILAVTQFLLTYGKTASLSRNEIKRIAESIQVFLNRVSRLWEDKNNQVSDQISQDTELHEILPDSRYRFRWWIELSDLWLKCSNSGNAKLAMNQFVSFDSDELEFEKQIRFLQSSCAEDEDLAIAPIKLFSYIDILVRVAGGPVNNASITERVTKYISGDEVPLKYCDNSSDSENKVNALKRLLPPVQFVRYMAMCVRSWARNQNEYPGLCDTAVHEVIRIAYDDICPGVDRKLFIDAIRELRETIVESTLGVYSDLPEIIDPYVFLEWSELLDHRLLIEEYLTGVNLGNDSSDEIVPPGSWGAVNGEWLKREWLEHPKVVEMLKNWETHWINHANAQALISETISHGEQRPHSSSLGNIQCKENDSNQVDNIHNYMQVSGFRNRNDIPAEFRDVQGFRSRFTATLQSNCIWIKSAFGHDGRVYWWAFDCESHSVTPKLIAKGKSPKGAKRRITLESNILDAKIEVAYALPYCRNDEDWLQKLQDIKRYWSFIDPDDVLCRALPTTFDKVTRSEFEGLVKCARDVLQRLEISPEDLPSDLCWRPEFVNVRRLAEKMLDTLTTTTTGSIERILAGWKATVSLLRYDWSDSTDMPNQDVILNQSCRTHLESVLVDFNIESIADFKGIHKKDIVFTVDGPLVSVPIDWLPINGEPLFKIARSVSVLLSTSLAVTPPQVDDRDLPEREVFAAIWAQKRNVHDGLNVLHARLHQLTEKTKGQLLGWRCRTAVDEPKATRKAIESTLRSSAFPIVLFGAHGLVGGGGKKSRIMLYQDDNDKVKEIWEGSGDLRSNELVLLCACIVGRMFEDDASDIRGLYTEVLVRGARTFCGARWSIHQAYAALFCIEIVKQLVKVIDAPYDHEYSGPFRVARIINSVRQEMLDKMPGAMHTLSAFSVFGLSGLDKPRLKYEQEKSNY